MRKQYDFSNARRNPYAKRLKKQVTTASTNWAGFASASLSAAEWTHEAQGAHGGS